MSSRRRKENPVREWFSDNLRYIVLILLLAAIVAGVVFIVLTIRKRQENGTRSAAVETEVTPEAVSASSAETVVTPEPTDAPEPTPEETPEPDALHTLTEAETDAGDVIQAYYDGLLASDQNNLIGSYDQFAVFTSPGAADGEYVAFASYRYKYKQFDTPLPALTSFYLAPDADGRLAIVDEPSADQQAIMEDVIADADAQALISSVTAEYEKVLGENTELAAFVESLQE